MKVSAPTILSALLRHHVRPGLNGQEKSAEINAVLKELSGASTIAEKHLIIERLLLREQRALNAAEAGTVAAGEEPPPAVWRMSNKSTDILNGLKTQHSSRQWETEAIIRTIFEQAQSGHAAEQLPGLAHPFKPTAQDMARAIESLGYSPKALFSDDPVPFTMNTEADVGRSAMRLVLMTSGVLMIGLMLFLV